MSAIASSSATAASTEVSVAVERALHRLERERGGAQPDLLVDVLEDERVLPLDVAAARATEADVVADHRLQLERDVLDDVRRVRAAAQPHDEAAALADRAAVLDQPGHRADAAARRSRARRPTRWSS